MKSILELKNFLSTTFKGARFGSVSVDDYISEISRIEAQARLMDELVEAAKRVNENNKNHAYFGGELYWDRINRAWDALDVILAKIEGEGK